MRNELFADTVVIFHHEKLFTSPSNLMISQKVALRLFARRGRISPPPPSEINSDGSTPTSGRRAKRPGRLTDFLRVRQICIAPEKSLHDANMISRITEPPVPRSRSGGRRVHGNRMRHQTSCGIKIRRFWPAMDPYRISR